MKTKVEELLEIIPSNTKIRELEAIIEILKREFPDSASNVILQIVRIEI